MAQSVLLSHPKTCQSALVLESVFLSKNLNEFQRKTSSPFSNGLIKKIEHSFSHRVSLKRPPPTKALQAVTTFTDTPQSFSCRGFRIPHKGERQKPIGAQVNGTAAFNADVSLDISLMLQAVSLAESSISLTAPHPNAGCVIADSCHRVVGRGALYAQGCQSCEVQAMAEARESARGGTAYCNLETGDCHGDDAALQALLESGVSRVVVGLRNPLSHLTGKAISLLQEAGIAVEVFGEGRLTGECFEDVIHACQTVNLPLLYRAKYKMPFSVLKYAMTLDGKIAASTGHAAWVTSPQARQRVFATRAQSDAIIVGGNTVRRDDPRLTTRQESGHIPIRIVMSRTLRLPEDANLWNVSLAPTIVMTQRGARGDFQQKLRKKGVEVVEFDFLTPAAVMEYCYHRGFLQVMWECGGTLSAPAIAGGVIHKVLAFVAPKIIGGTTAPSPVGELGFVEMTQALNLLGTSFEVVGPDMLVTGYLHPIPDPRPPVLPGAVDALLEAEGSNSGVLQTNPPSVISFYKPWDPYGAFSNFSPHPITTAGGPDGCRIEWKSVEQYYQVQKFAKSKDPVAQEAVKLMMEAMSPEEVARIGRRLERSRPDLVHPNWQTAKVAIMYEGLREKFKSYPALKALLLSTTGSALIEASPHDYFWGAGRTGMGQNHLGRLLMKLRAEILGEEKNSLNYKCSSSSGAAAFAS